LGLGPSHGDRPVWSSSCLGRRGTLGGWGAEHLHIRAPSGFRRAIQPWGVDLFDADDICSEIGSCRWSYGCTNHDNFHKNYKCYFYFDYKANNNKNDDDDDDDFYRKNYDQCNCNDNDCHNNKNDNDNHHHHHPYNYHNYHPYHHHHYYDHHYYNYHPHHFHYYYYYDSGE
jgi:hypothetical protein